MSLLSHTLERISTPISLSKSSFCFSFPPQSFWLPKRQHILLTFLLLIVWFPSGQGYLLVFFTATSEAPQTRPGSSSRRSHLAKIKQIKLERSVIGGRYRQEVESLLLHRSPGPSRDSDSGCLEWSLSLWISNRNPSDTEAACRIVKYLGLLFCKSQPSLIWEELQAKKAELCHNYNHLLEEKICSANLYVGFPGGSDGKESACNAGDSGSILGLRRSPGEGMATHSSILAWRIPWTEELGGL